MKNHILIVGTISFDENKTEMMVNEVSKVLIFDSFEFADEIGESYLSDGYDSYTVISDDNPVNWSVSFAEEMFSRVLNMLIAISM